LKKAISVELFDIIIWLLISKFARE